MHLKVHLIHGPNLIFIIYSSFEKRLFLMNARAYQREEAEMILSKSRDINVVFTLFNSVHCFTYMFRNYSTVFRMLLIHHSMTMIFISQKTD